jgi:histidinol-phosphate phosphatase family protein
VRNQGRAVLLDRDGVINPDVGHPHRPEDAVLFADVGPALARIQQAGYALAVVSNQSGIGRGYFGVEDVIRFNGRLVAALQRHGVVIELDNFFICPHAPDENCACRKPQPGLIRAAAERLALDLSRSVLIGDAESDVMAGRAAGVATILLDRRGSVESTGADWRCRDLLEAAILIDQISPTAELR